jgi:hypothetical protein
LPFIISRGQLITINLKTVGLMGIRLDDMQLYLTLIIRHLFLCKGRITYRFRQPLSGSQNSCLIYVCSPMSLLGTTFSYHYCYEYCCDYCYSPACSASPYNAGSSTFWILRVLRISQTRIPPYSHSLTHLFPNQIDLEFINHIDPDPN